MTSDSEDFTICWVPPANGALARFGRRWTGWCAELAERQPRLGSPWRGLDLHALAAGVSLKGLHGVFHGPFRLQHARMIWTLEPALRTLADETRAPVIRGFEIGVVGCRVALVPAVPAPALDDLAHRIRLLARDFEPPERAAAHGGRSAARAPGNGSLVRPETSFHLPLTDPLQEPSACHVAARLRPLVEPALRQMHSIGELALLVGRGDGMRATVEKRFALYDGTGGAGSTFACCGPRLYAPLTGPERLVEPV